MEPAVNISNVEDITIEDCHTILRKKLGSSQYALIEYKVTPFAVKCGFYGEHSDLIIKIRDNDGLKELHFFIKGIPKENAAKHVVITANFFYKELSFYTKLVQKMTANNINSIKECVSECYLGRLNDLLVFDNYLQEGYTTISSRTSFTFETAVLVVKKLAKLHASALILEEKLSTSEIKYRLEDDCKMELAESYYTDGKENLDMLKAITKGALSVIDLYFNENSEVNTQDFKVHVANAFNKLQEQVKPSIKHRNVICHGDLWSNNIFIKFENGKPTDCKFIDFQAIRYCPPAMDLLSFLHLTTNRKFRSQYLYKIQDLYYREITKVFNDNGVDVNDVMTYEEFLESSEDMKQFTVTQTMKECQRLMLTSDQIKITFSDSEVVRRLLFEDRSPFIVKYCLEDHVYRKKLFECVADLKELYESKDMLS